jgi:hypothetical protein
MQIRLVETKIHAFLLDQQCQTMGISTGGITGDCFVLSHYAYIVDKISVVNLLHREGKCRYSSPSVIWTIWGGGVVWITQESGPLRGNFVLSVTYKKSPLSAKLKLLKSGNTVPNSI